MFNNSCFPTEAEFKCHNKIDMVILLDSSAGVEEDVFAATKKFAADLIRHFEISKDRTNVATLSFSQYVQTGRNFGDKASQESVLKAIDGLKYEGSFTRLDFALQRIQDITFSKDHGARSYDKGKLFPREGRGGALLGIFGDGVAPGSTNPKSVFDNFFFLLDGIYMAF